MKKNKNKKCYFINDVALIAKSTALTTSLACILHNAVSSETAVRLTSTGDRKKSFVSDDRSSVIMTDERFF
jgi:hypothetical protein